MCVYTCNVCATGMERGENREEGGGETGGGERRGGKANRYVLHTHTHINVIPTRILTSLNAMWCVCVCNNKKSSR